MLELRNLTGGWTGTTVIENLSLKLAAGGTTAIIGRNGVGKSTLLELVVGRAERQTGQILLGDTDLSTRPGFKRAVAGIGYVPQEREVFPSLTVAENLSVAKRAGLWTEDRVEHKGRFYTVTDAGLSLKPVRPGGPPLYIAGQADVSVRRAARIGDAWLIVNSGGLGKITPLMKTYRAALAEFGRTPIDFPITIECYVGENNATAHEECREPLEYKYNAYASWGLQDRVTQTTFPEFARDRFIIGDKVKVKEEIARYHELLGVDHFIMRCQWPGLPVEKTLGSIKRLGEIFA